MKPRKEGYCAVLHHADDDVPSSLLLASSVLLSPRSFFSSSTTTTTLVRLRNVLFLPVLSFPRRLRRQCFCCSPVLRVLCAPVPLSDELTQRLKRGFLRPCFFLLSRVLLDPFSWVAGMRYHQPGLQPNQRLDATAVADANAPGSSYFLLLSWLLVSLGVFLPDSFNSSPACWGSFRSFKPYIVCCTELL